MKRLILIVILLVIFLLYGCSSYQQSIDDPSTLSSTKISPTRISTKTISPTPTHTLTPTLLPTKTPKPTATPIGGSRMAYVGIRNCPYEFWKPCSYEGTVQFDILTSSVKLLWDGDFNLEAFSPDGQSLLLSSGSDLYIADIDAYDPVKISSNFSKGLEISALWPRSDLIVFIGTTSNEIRIHIVKPDGSDLQVITPYGKIVYQLISVNNDQGVLWEEGYLEPRGFFGGGLYWTDFESLNTHPIPHSSHFSPSPEGNEIAYESRPYVQDDAGRSLPVSHLMILDLEIMESHEIPLPDLGIFSSITNLIWLNDGDHLMVGRNKCRSTGVGEWTCDMHTASIIDIDGNEILELPELFGYISDPWHSSPDGKLLYRVSSQEDVDNWRNWFGCFNISTLSDIHCPNIPYTEAPLSGPVLWGPISTPLSQLASPATTKSYPSKLYFLDESSLDNEEKINLALGLFELLSSGDQLPPDNLYIGIVDIETQEYWAKIEVTIVDDEGKSVVGEGAIYLAKRQGDDWEIAIPGTNLYKNWIEQIPESLVPEELKEFLR